MPELRQKISAGFSQLPDVRPVKVGQMKGAKDVNGLNGGKSRLKGLDLQDFNARLSQTKLLDAKGNFPKFSCTSHCRAIT
jgi:hypothetical protein